LNNCLFYIGRTGGGPSFAYSLFYEDFDTSDFIICSTNNELLNLYKSDFPNRVYDYLIPVTFLQLIGGWLTILLSYRRLLTANKITITAYHPLLFLYLLLLLPKRQDVSVFIHDVEPHTYSRLESWFQKISIFFGYRITVISESQSKIFKQKYNILPSVRLHPPYLHYKSNSFQNIESFKGENIFFLFFGRVESYKGLDLICNLSIKSNSPIVRVIGKGPCPKCLKDNPLIEVLPRYVHDQEVPSLLGSCKVLILPYKSATQSGLFQLASMFNIPIIATPLEVFVEQSKNAKVPVYFSKKVSASSFLERMEDVYDLLREG